MIDALIVSNLALWVLLAVLSLVVLALVRQLGVLHERVRPVGALLLKRGLKVGEPAPQMTVRDLDGRALSIGEASTEPRSTLLVFISPSCPVCKALVPVLKASHGSERRWLKIVLASDGPEDEQRRYRQANGLEEFPYVLSAQLGMSFQVERLPFAAIIDAAGILRARGLINSREHLESLFEAQRRGVASLQDLAETSRDSRVA
jgi:methylamine dehydrogenase accessory protein MauD